MARRSAPPSKPERPFLTIDQKRRGIERIRRRIQELESFDAQKVSKRWPPEATALETAIDEALSSVFGNGTIEYNRYSRAATLDNGPIIMDSGFRGHDESREVFDARQYLTEGKSASILMLQQAIKALEEEISEQQHEISPASPAQPAGVASRRVFVVHGHDAGARDAVARFLEKIELEAIILQEQPDRGMTVIEKFEVYANQVAFAVVLLTPDDLVGEGSEGAPSARARQNVIFELGYFVGKLGRGHACLLRKGVVEIPSDLYGVIYTDLDSADGWKLKLIKELKASGLEFDANKVWS